MDAAPGGSVRPAVVAAALLLGQQVASRATRDALFLSVFHVSSLPVMAAVAAAVALAATVAASRALGRLSPARLLPVALAGSVVAFCGEWALARGWPRPAAVAVYLHHALLGAVLVSGFWSLVTERFDPHAAKRAMGAIGAGASLGGVLGGLLTWAAAARLSPRAMLLVLSLVSAGALAAVGRLARGARTHGGASTTPALPGRGALEILRQVPFLRALALLVVLTAFLDAVLDYLLAAAATSRFGSGAPLMSFFALFHAGTGLVGLAAQAVAVGPLLQRLGPAWTLAAPTAFTAAGAAAVALLPRLASIVALRGGHGVLRNSAFRSGYELLYTPLPEPQKRPTKVLIDIAGERSGAILGSLAVTATLLAAPAAALRILPVLAGAVAVLALALTPRLRRGYVGALASSLRHGTASFETPDLVDPATLLSLASLHVPSPTVTRQALSTDGPAADPLLAAIADLRSGDPARITGALTAELDGRLVAHAIPLLAQDGLFDTVAGSLRRAAPRCTGQLVDALLDPRLEPMVRRRVARVLKGVATQRSADGLLLGLGDGRFDLRYRCAQALLRVRAQAAEITVPAAHVLAIAAREAAHAGESERHFEHCFTLLALVLDPDPVEGAYRALRSADARLRGTALEYLENVLPAAVREPLWPHLGAPARPVPSGRTAEEIRAELVRSSIAVRRTNNPDR